MPSACAKELTPAQHAAIREQLFLIPVYIWVVFAWSVFFAHLPIGPWANSTYVFRDFAHFYSQGVITREHDAHALYDIDAMARVVDRIVPVKIEAKYPPVYGPQVGLFFSPLARLPYVSAMVVWLAITIGGYLVCVYLVWRKADALHNRRWTMWVLALGAAGLHFTLSFAQISILGLACFTGIWVALRSNRPFLAGIATGALAYKPQLAVVAACVFVLAQEWRVVAGALAAVAAQIAAAAAYWGPAIFLSYVGALWKLPGVIEGMEPDKALMHSWRSMLLQVGFPATAALIASVLLSVATIAAAVVAWRTRGPLAPRYVTLVVATLLVDPHIFAYDLMVLTPALLVAWDWARTQHGTLADLFAPHVRGRARRVRLRTALLSATAFVYFAPLVTIVLSAIPLQWSVVGFVGLGGMATLYLIRHPTVTSERTAMSANR